MVDLLCASLCMLLGAWSVTFSIMDPGSSMIHPSTGFNGGSNSDTLSETAMQYAGNMNDHYAGQCPADFMSMFERMTCDADPCPPEAKPADCIQGQNLEINLADEDTYGGWDKFGQPPGFTGYCTWQNSPHNIPGATQPIYIEFASELGDKYTAVGEAILGVLLWLKTIFFSRCSRERGGIVRTLAMCTSAIVPFFGVLITFYIAILHYYVAVSRVSLNDSITVVGTEDRSFPWRINNPWELMQAMTGLYRVIMLGDFDVGEWNDSYLAIGIFIIASFFGLLIMVNLLITILGEAYGEVQAQAHVAYYRERVKLMLDVWDEQSILGFSVPSIEKILKREYDRDDFLHVSYPEHMITDGRMPSEWFDTVAEENANMTKDVNQDKELDVVQTQRDKIDALAAALQVNVKDADDEDPPEPLVDSRHRQSSVQEEITFISSGTKNLEALVKKNVDGKLSSIMKDNENLLAQNQALKDEMTSIKIEFMQEMRVLQNLVKNSRGSAVPELPSPPKPSQPAPPAEEPPSASDVRPTTPDPAAPPQPSAQPQAPADPLPEIPAYGRLSELPPQKEDSSEAGDV